MTTGIAPAFAGSKMETGIIDFCPGCKQRSELMGNGHCAKCNEEQAWEDSDPRKKLPPRVDPAPYLKKNQNSAQAIELHEEVTPEKARYLEIIRSASPELVDEIVKDIYEKKILHYDFNQIVLNERWFSLMDLRRMALRINPNFEKDLKQEDFEENYIEEDEKPKKKIKRRKK